VADVRTPQSAPGTSDRDVQAGRHPTDEALDTAKGKASELKERTRAEAEAAGQQVRDATDEAKREAHGIAEQGKERVRSMATQQKHAAAGQLSGFAHALKSASGDLESRGQQFAARWTEQAADGLERASDALERRDFDDLMAGVEDFARRQPVAFLGGAVIAGFGLARLMKSSAERRHGPSSGTREYQTHAGGVAGGAMPGTSPGGAEAAGSAGPAGTAASMAGLEPGRNAKGERQ
jgi:vacuolar-type H+-ATPase subunit H